MAAYSISDVVRANPVVFQKLGIFTLLMIGLPLFMFYLAQCEPVFARVVLTPLVQSLAPHPNAAACLFPNDVSYSLDEIHSTLLICPLSRTHTRPFTPVGIDGDQELKNTWR